MITFCLVVLGMVYLDSILCVVLGGSNGAPYHRVGNESENGGVRCSQRGTYIGLLHKTFKPLRLFRSFLLHALGFGFNSRVYSSLTREGVPFLSKICFVGACGQSEFGKEVPLFEVEATAVEPTFDRLYSYLFGLPADAAPENNRALPNAIFVLNLDKVCELLLTGDVKFLWF